MLSCQDPITGVRSSPDSAVQAANPLAACQSHGARAAPSTRVATKYPAMIHGAESRALSECGVSSGAVGIIRESDGGRTEAGRTAFGPIDDMISIANDKSMWTAADWQLGNDKRDGRPYCRGEAVRVTAVLFLFLSA